MNNPNQGWKSRQKRTAAQAQLKVVGFLLILMVVFGAVSVSAIQDPPGDPWRLGNESLFTWQVLSSTKQGVQCTLVIDHSGAPSEDEILLSCDRATSAAWGESQACVSMIAYGQDHECEGLYLQWVGSQPYSPFASIILDDPMWGIVPGEEKLPTWLVQPDNVQELASDRPLTLLAGNLITKQFVNANGCPGHGLLPNGAANACGEIVARPAVTDWQNQFDSIIYGAALQTKVPAQLLKNIFIQETQFWPASSRESANTEHGFGHMTQNGADTLLMWNKVFFDNFCPTVLSEYSCLVGYFMMPSEQQALLRGAVLEAVDADCPTCMAAIDFEKAAASIPIFAHALAANGNQVEQMIFNLTGKPAAGLVSYEDLWKFTAANYNAGPWCLNVSFNQTLRVGEYLRWKRIATHFPEACEGVLGYVKNVTQFDVPEEASEDLVNNPLTPTPVSTPTAPVVAAANQPYTTLPTASSPPSQTTEILVQFRPVLSLFSGFAIRAAQGEKIEDLDGMRNIVISVPATQFAEALKELQGSWLVAYAEPNAIVQAAGRQVSHNSGAAFSGHFGAAQAQTLSDPRVIVAVIDSGIDIQHAELKASIWINGGEDYTDNQGDDLRSNNVDDDDNGYVDDWAGWNFVDGDNDVTDLYGHGTHTAGIIITESAGKAAVLPVKALNAFGYGTYGGAAEAIIYAVDQGASIIHLGFGGLEASRTLQEAVDYAYENGALVISAAGNSGDGTLWYPAVLPRVIAAAAVDNQNLRAAFSSYGEHLSLAAPGVDILSTYPGGGTTSMSGTSMSAAAISGTAAQLASLPQFDSPDKIRAALQNTALDLGSTGKDEYYGFGLVQPDAALAYLISATPTPEPWVTVALTPAGDGIGAMALEQLFGSAQTCSYGTISTPANSIDLAFNDATAACAGPVAPGGSWEYTAIQDTLLSSVASASLDVRFFMSGLSNDTITLEVSKNNGGSWSLVDSFGMGSPPPVSLTTMTYDVSSIFTTPAEVNAARVRFYGQNRQGGSDAVTIALDEVRLDVSDTSNTAPVVTITAPANSSSYTQGTTVNFVGTGIDTEDGDISANLSWSSDLDGAIGSGASFSTSALSVGTHTITASVTDSGSLSGNDSISVTINPPPNTAPVVSITAPADSSSFTEGTAVNFTGTGIDSEDGDISANLSWSSDLDGAIGSGASFSTSALSVGTHTITASVTDSGSLSGNDSITVTINPPGNTAPVVTITAPADSSSFSEGTTVNFTGTGIDSEDGDISASLSWSSDLDGVIGSGAGFSTSSLSVGTHTITASVTDSGSLSGNDSITVTINPPGNTAPNAVHDSYSTPIDTTLNVTPPGVLNNDTDGESDPLTAVLDTTVSNGTLTLNSNGSFDYTPNALFVGIDSFTYYAHDGTVNSATPATVTIAVGSTNPHGGYTATTDMCAGCHRAHTAQSPNLITSSLTNNAYCFSCHDGSGVSYPGSIVSTHSNIDKTGTDEANFELLCIQCHDPHGSSNLAAVLVDVRVLTSPLTTTGPVSFTALTGTNSFDDGTSAEVTRICVTCHANTSNVGYPMTNHTGGANHTGSVDYTGQDCTDCHKHDADDAYVTRDGFMPNGCTGCHAAATDNSDGLPVGGRRAVVGEFGLSSHHILDSVLTDGDCVVCHDQSTHMDGKVDLIHADSVVTVYTETGSGSFRTENLTTADNNALNTFCQSCHDGDGATRLGGSAMTPFSGTANPTTVGTHANTDFGSRVEAVFQSGCAQCHASHGSSNLSLVNTTLLVTPGTTTGSILFTSLTGTNSFDDGTSATNTRICTACHVDPANPGSPMAQHVGGDHAGGALGSNEEGGNCSLCHGHDMDKDPATLDGFMPSGGTCVGCHKINQGTRRQIVDDNGDGTGANGDFKRASHHMSNLDIPTDGDCEICHDQSGHMSGTVNLFNVDTLASYALDGVDDPGRTEAFCLSCHDANGANGDSTPFSDSASVVEINNASWTNASHNASTGSCVDCHDNGHGSNKVSMLAPWDYTDDADPDDPMMEEERFCYDCHDTDGPAASNVAATFAPTTNWANAVVGTNAMVDLNDRHDIALTDQTRSGAKIECVDCHNPHIATAANPLIADPDPGDGQIPGSGYVTGADFMTDWCSDCHDGSYPAGVVDAHSDGSSPVGLINVLSFWNADSNKDDTHGAQTGGVNSIEPDPPGTDGWVLDITVQCMDCHVRHVSSPTAVTGGTNLFHVKSPVRDRTNSFDLFTNASAGLGTLNYELTIVSSFISDQQNGYSWCNTCHDGDDMKSGDANCTACHMHGTKW